MGAARRWRRSRPIVKGLVETAGRKPRSSPPCSAPPAPGEQVLDFCAGGGGKTLALAAQMHNRGQIYAYDDDGRRLMPIHERLERAGARNIQVRAPRGKADVLADLTGRCDLVLIDAPCTGTGAWRRHPDAKWRLAPGALEHELKEQRELLAKAVALREARRAARLRHLFGAARGERGRRSRPFSPPIRILRRIQPPKLAEGAGLPDLARFASPHGRAFACRRRQAARTGFTFVSWRSAE